jgi:hypothetical protein
MSGTQGEYAALTSRAISPASAVTALRTAHSSGMLASGFVTTQRWHCCGAASMPNGRPAATSVGLRKPCDVVTSDDQGLQTCLQELDRSSTFRAYALWRPLVRTYCRLARTAQRRVQRSSAYGIPREEESMMTPAPHRRASAHAHRSRHRTAAIVATSALALTFAVGMASPAAASSSAGPRAAAPSPTRAALDPILVTGRGAQVDFVEQEAEKAVTDGSVIGPSTDAYTLPAEASGRSAVSLSPGHFVQFTLPVATNAITVRYSIPDAPNGGGITAPLTVSALGLHKTMTLSSQYSWLYNAYPFSNDPTLTTSIEPDWWTVECNCSPGTATTFPAPFRPNHFYDEQRMLLGRTLPAGTTLRLTAPESSTASATVIDLLDSQRVGPAAGPHGRAVTWSPSARILPAGTTPRTRSTGPSPSPT